MLISHRKKFIFTKTVKTASTSVELLFEKFCIPENKPELLHSDLEQISSDGVVGARGKGSASATFYNHMPLHEIQKLIDAIQFEEYFKFTTIRNPYNKIVSYFFYLEKRIEKLKRKGQLDKIKKFNINSSITNDVARFRAWLSDGGMELDRSKYFIGEDLGVDFFIRFEHLNEDICTALNKLDIPLTAANNLMHKKNSGNKNPLDVKKFFDHKSKALIEEIYAWELAHFGYQLS